MFIVTEASGVSETIFNAIEGNLQGDSRILIVFNYNTPIGYAATSQKSNRWHKFRLDSLTAPNVLQKKMVIPGQVDYEWVKDKVETWCNVISEADVLESEGDFKWEGKWYRPNDLFRVKVRGLAPKVSSDVLMPYDWKRIAIEKWEANRDKPQLASLRLGVDVAGMGRDSSSFCFRYGNYVKKFRLIQSGGVANHMEITGIAVNELTNEYDVSINSYPQAFIDTIGEGAGVFSRINELKDDQSETTTIKKLRQIPIHSVKGGEAAKRGDRELKDVTGQYVFRNMRAYLYWCVRDWLNPDNKTGAMLPPGEYQGLTDVMWNMRSDGVIELESKEDLKKRIGRSPDEEDSLAMTFYPAPDMAPKTGIKKKSAIKGFF